MGEGFVQDMQQLTMLGIRGCIQGPRFLDLVLKREQKENIPAHA
jgi:hypothetical protein